MKKVLIITLCVVLFFCIGEFACRIHIFSKIPSDQLSPKLKGKIALFLSGGAYVFEFRDQWFLINKPRDVYRIMVLGGSTTECSYVEYTKSWTYKLQEKLNVSGVTKKTVEVVNLGFVGATSIEEYFNLITHFDLIQPDLVINYDGFNDLMASNATYATYFIREKRVYDILAKKKIFLKLNYLLNKNSALYNRLADNLHDLHQSLNTFIFKYKLFGIDSQKRSRSFADVKWYKNIDYIWGERDYLGGKYLLDKFYADATRNKLSPNEYALAEGIVRELTGNKQEANVDTFLGRLIKYPAPELTKRHILSALGIDEIRFTVGSLKVSYHPLDLTGNANIHKDLLPEVYKFNLENMARFAAAKNTPIVFIFQPFLSEKLLRLGLGVNEQTFKGMSSFDLEANRHVASVYDLRSEKMKEAALQYHAPYFNFQKVFDAYENEQVYVDNCHNSEFGLDVLAQKASEALVENHLIQK